MNNFSFEKWDNNKYTEYISYMKSISDSEYLKFNKKLVFTDYKMMGVKTSLLRTLAKDISKGDIISFLNISNHEYYEEILVFGFVIGYIKDLDIFMKYFNKFIRYIDNWAVCDMCISSMKIVKKNKDYFFKLINKYVIDSNPYVVRVGTILLLDYYIDDEYIDKIFYIIDNINREEYYINMSIAWLVSICFIKYRNKTLEYLKNCKLNKFTYNKALQKSRESLRVSPEDKILLQSMKIK